MGGHSGLFFFTNACCGEFGACSVDLSFGRTSYPSGFKIVFTV